MSAAAAVAAHNLSHAYGRGLMANGRHYALRDVHLEVPRGSVWGLVGANGAGKTTLLHCLVGLLRPSFGRASLLGEADGDKAALAQVGFLPELFVAPPWLTAREYLRCCGELSGCRPAALTERIEGTLANVDLLGLADVRVANFSKGTRQRLGLAQSLVHRPALLVWDEPTTGLDPLGRRLLADLVAEQKARGTTLLLATHVLADVAQLCDGVTVLGGGRVLAHGHWDALARDHGCGRGELEDLFLAVSKTAAGPGDGR